MTDYNLFYKMITTRYFHDVDMRIDEKYSSSDYYASVRQNITLQATADREMFDGFVNDILSLNELRNEKYIRDNNPTVQRAYEEYQLLLKLSK